jgi:hypothetical protein
VGKSAEDLLPADPALGEVDRFRRAGISLSWGELAEGTVRPGIVIVQQVFGQHPSQVVCSLTISTRSKSSRRRVPMILSQIALALSACGGQARILVPSAVNTASKELVNWPARS